VKKLIVAISALLALLVSGGAPFNL